MLFFSFVFTEFYRVQVYLQCSGGGTGSMCPIEALEEDVVKGLPGTHWVLGRVSVDRSTHWAQLSAALSHTFTSHLQILCGESQMAREEMQRPPLGLSPASIASVLIGEETLYPVLCISIPLLFLHCFVFLVLPLHLCLVFLTFLTHLEFLHLFSFTLYSFFSFTCHISFLHPFMHSRPCVHPLIFLELGVTWLSNLLKAKGKDKE